MRELLRKTAFAFLVSGALCALGYWTSLDAPPPEDEDLQVMRPDVPEKENAWTWFAKAAEHIRIPEKNSKKELFYEVTGGESRAAARIGPGEWVAVTLSGTPLAGGADAFAARWSHVAPWARPVWMAPWSFAYLALALLVGLAWGGAEAVLARRRIAATVARLR